MIVIANCDITEQHRLGWGYPGASLTLNVVPKGTRGAVLRSFEQEAVHMVEVAFDMNGDETRMFVCNVPVVYVDQV